MSGLARHTFCKTEPVKERDMRRRTRKSVKEPASPPQPTDPDFLQQRVTRGHLKAAAARKPSSETVQVIEQAIQSAEQKRGWAKDHVRSAQTPEQRANFEAREASASFTTTLAFGYLQDHTLRRRASEQAQLHRSDWLKRKLESYLRAEPQINEHRVRRRLREEVSSTAKRDSVIAVTDDCIQWGTSLAS